MTVVWKKMQHYVVIVSANTRGMHITVSVCVGG